MAFATIGGGLRSPSFLHLPPEVRNRLYDLAFASTYLNVTKRPAPSQGKNLSKKALRKAASANSGLPHLAVFRDSCRGLTVANKQIRQEGISYLYDNLSVRVPSSIYQEQSFQLENQHIQILHACLQARHLEITDGFDVTLGYFGVPFNHWAQLLSLTFCLRTRMYYDGKSPAIGSGQLGHWQACDDNISKLLRQCLEELRSGTSRVLTSQVLETERETPAPGDDLRSENVV